MQEILNFLSNLGTNTWFLLQEMAPYLLLGFFIAGLLKIVLPKNILFKHLSKGNLWSIIKASIFGVPLPLCSCGVIPVAEHLRKEGASKSSILSFISSTPETGVDSFFATYSLMGIVFAIARPIIALFIGIFTGVMELFFGKITYKVNPNLGKQFSCAVCDIKTPHSHSLNDKIKFIFSYAFIDLVADLGKWLIIGILAGALLTTLIPVEFGKEYFGNPIISYALMFVVGIPLYVCSTGSIPIAASFLMLGMNPGAVLVFLIVGPATNTATISFIAGKMGKRTLFIYLISIVIGALTSGMIFDFLITSQTLNLPFMHHHEEGSSWFKLATAGVLIVLLLITFGSRIFKPKEKLKMEGLIFKVGDMTCQHCVKIITSALQTLDCVDEVGFDLKKRLVEIDGDCDKSEVFAAIIEAGYTPEDIE